MSISSLSVYSNSSRYQWQSTQNSSSSSSRTQNELSGLSPYTSMASQISGMVELVQYAMKAMGLSEDSRVTFSQISKYQQQVEKEFDDSLKKATTEMLVLFVLRQKSMYTYEMMSAIESLSEGRLSFNTLYQAIYRLRDHGYIRESEKVLSQDNRMRIYFSITEEGQVYLDALRREYQSFIDAVALIFSKDGSLKGGNADDQ